VTWSLEQAYEEYPQIEDEFSAVLDESLHPRGPDLLYDLVARLGLATGVVPGNADPARTEAAIAAAGLRIDERLEIGSEWSEWAEERHGSASRKLLHASRLCRNQSCYLERYGQAAYDMMLGDCLWHVYATLGKLNRRVYLLSRDGPEL
jgi:hypothetical protein